MSLNKVEPTHFVYAVRTHGCVAVAVNSNDKLQVVKPNTSPIREFSLQLIIIENYNKYINRAWVDIQLVVNRGWYFIVLSKSG